MLPANPSSNRVLIVGNAPPALDFSDIIDAHPFVVRLNAGGRSNIEKHWLGKKTDLVFINGYNGEWVFRPSDYVGVPIMWSRPIEAGLGYGLMVSPYLRHIFREVQKEECCIGIEYFKAIEVEYGIPNPSTGTITAYYFHKKGFSVDIVNMPLSPGLPNVFTKGRGTSHNASVEKAAIGKFCNILG